MKYLILILATCSSVLAFAQHKPNIIIIYADDLGYGDLSSYGGDIPTPNIDRIGRSGVRFTNFYVAGPVCTPSRFGLLTGAYPARSRQNLYTALLPLDKNHIDPAEKVLPEYLKDAGYRTGLIGKWHLGSEPEAFPTRRGFDLFTGLTGGCIDFFDHNYGTVEDDWYVNGKLEKESGYATELISRHAINFIDDISTDKRPFFLFLSFNAPHYGKTDPARVPDNTLVLKEEEYEGYPIANTLQAPEAYLKKFDHVNDPYRRMYSAMVSSLDDNVGKVLQAVEESGVLENTIIWFISDNGGYSQSYHGHASNGILRGQKGTLYEGGIHVPSLLMWQKKIKADQVMDQPVVNTDVLPTVSRIVGFETAGMPVDGLDIGDVLFQKKRLNRDIYWRFNEQSALRSGEWKMVNKTELYNLARDPSESKNLAGSHPEKLQELNSKYMDIEATFTSSGTD